MLKLVHMNHVIAPTDEHKRPLNGDLADVRALASTGDGVWVLVGGAAAERGKGADETHLLTHQTLERTRIDE